MLPFNVECCDHHLSLEEKLAKKEKDVTSPFSLLRVRSTLETRERSETYNKEDVSDDDSDDDFTKHQEHQAEDLCRRGMDRGRCARNI